MKTETAKPARDAGLALSYGPPQPLVQPEVAETVSNTPNLLRMVHGQVQNVAEVAARWALQANLSVIPQLREALDGEWGPARMIGGLPTHFPLLEYTRPMKDTEIFGTGARAIIMVRFQSSREDAAAGPVLPADVTGICDLTVRYVNVAISGVQRQPIEGEPGATAPKTYGRLVLSLDGRDLGL